MAMLAAVPPTIAGRAAKDRRSSGSATAAATPGRVGRARSWTGPLVADPDREEGGRVAKAALDRDL